MIESSHSSLISGAVEGSIIAGILSVAGVYINSRAKIAELRERWNNDLRAQVSIFVANVLNVCQSGSVTSTEFKKEISVSVNALHESRARVCLLLNPNEREHRAVLDLLNEIVLSLRKDDSVEQVSTLIEPLLANTRQILGHEWRRVKYGFFSFLTPKHWMTSVAARLRRQTPLR